MLPFRAAASRLPLTTPRSVFAVTRFPSHIAKIPVTGLRWKSNGSGQSNNIPPFRKPPSLDDRGRPVKPSVQPAQSPLSARIDRQEESSDSPEQPESGTQEPDAPSKPQKPLPDLRFGIPSTFEQEYMKDGEKEKSEDTTHQKFDASGTEYESEPSGSGSSSGGRGDGEIPKSAYESSIDKRRNRMAQIFYISALLFGTAGALWAGRDWETAEEEKRFPEAPSGWGLQQFYNRIRARIKDQLGYYTEPTFPKLLPEIKDHPAPPYTLVISLEDMLIHSEWTREHGWRTAKRPGVDFFLLYLSQYYELCLFTSQPMGIADPLVRKLDPYHLMQWQLFREATRYDQGEYVKDLSYLNRPVPKTILVDTKAGHAKAQPENSIILKPWNGDPSDRELLTLIPFLEYVAVMGIEDVRSAIQSFEGKHIPTEFAAREARMRAQYAKDLAAAKASKRGGRGLKSIADRVVKGGAGGANQDQMSLVDAMAEGKTMFDVMREEGMKRYRMMEKEIKENGDKWLKEEAELLKRMEEEQMKNMKTNPLSMFGLGGPSSQIDPQKVMEQLQKEKEEREKKQ